MNKKFAIIFCGFLFAMSCQHQVAPEIPPGQGVPTVQPVEKTDNGGVESVTFRIDPMVVDEDGVVTKGTIGESGNGKKTVFWEAADTVGIYPNTGAQVYFEITSGTGSEKVTFDGGGWAFKTTATYYSYFPFIGDIYLDRNQIPVWFSDQWQKGTTELGNQISPHAFMYTDGCSVQGSSIEFIYHQLFCFIRPRLVGLPAGTYTKLAISAPTNVFPIKGYYDLMAASPAIVPTEYTNQLIIDLKDFVISEGQDAYVYVMSAPVLVQGVELTISVLNSQKKEFQCKKTPSANYNAGEIKGLKCENFTEVPQSVGMIMSNWESGANLGGEAE